jgi:two-component system LytT family response regulator
MGEILIIDDDIIFRRGLHKIAISLDKNIQIYETGMAKEALEIAKQKDIDAFFLDIKLLDYSGLQLAQQLRNIDKYKFTPIVFITSVPTREFEAFRNIHCYTYLVKPFSVEKAKEVLETIIKYGIKKDEPTAIKIDKGSLTYIIRQEDIIYIERTNRKTYIITPDEKIETNCSLNCIDNLLINNFTQCHKSYIVNDSFIKKIDRSNNMIHLEGMHCVPIGRKYKENVIEYIYSFN